MWCSKYVDKAAKEGIYVSDNANKLLDDNLYKYTTLKKHKT